MDLVLLVYICGHVVLIVTELL